MTNVWGLGFLLEPLQYVFIQRALLASVLVGAVCALLGVYVVLRRMSNIGHALTHSALPGLVLAYMWHANLFLGALLSTLATALGIGVLSRHQRVYEDTAMGIVPTAMLAFGIMLISLTRSYRDMLSMLFGNILGISIADLLWIGGIALITVMVLFLLDKELVLTSIDPDYARSIGIPVDMMRYVLLILLTLAVVTGIGAVGTILTHALLVCPVATARLLTQKRNNLIFLSMLFSVGSCIIGVYLSYYLGLPSGASIVLVSAILFVICWLWQHRQFLSDSASQIKN